MAARLGRRHRKGVEAKRVEVAEYLVDAIDAEGAARGISCGLMADLVVELGLRALRAEHGNQEALIA